MANRWYVPRYGPSPYPRGGSGLNSALEAMVAFQETERARELQANRNEILANMGDDPLSMMGAAKDLIRSGDFDFGAKLFDMGARQQYVLTDIADQRARMAAQGDPDPIARFFVRDGVTYGVTAAGDVRQVDVPAEDVADEVAFGHAPGSLAEFSDPRTTQARRDEIIRQRETYSASGRAPAGRSGTARTSAGVDALSDSERSDLMIYTESPELLPNLTDAKRITLWENAKKAGDPNADRFKPSPKDAVKAAEGVVEEYQAILESYGDTQDPDQIVARNDELALVRGLYERDVRGRLALPELAKFDVRLDVDAASQVAQGGGVPTAAPSPMAQGASAVTATGAPPLSFGGVTVNPAGLPAANFDPSMLGGLGVAGVPTIDPGAKAIADAFGVR